jgi:hypothetical protein
MDEKRTYQVTYKVYHNERLKKISFHGRMVFPLYLRLTFDRRTTEYRSNLFDLFMQPKYAIRISGEIFPPPIEKVIQREEKLIESIIDRHSGDFSFELFKKEYEHYSRDLLNEMESGFAIYLDTFFDDEGMPYLGDALANNYLEVSLHDVTLDLKRAIRPDLYERLIDQSFLHAPPYFPLFQFAEKHFGRPLTALTMMDWENPAITEAYKAFMAKNYSTQDLVGVVSEIDQWLKQ